MVGLGQRLSGVGCWPVLENGGRSARSREGSQACLWRFIRAHAWYMNTVCRWAQAHCRGESANCAVCSIARLLPRNRYKIKETQLPRIQVRGEADHGDWILVRLRG